ncbi:hypothetical protein [Pedobacter mucosus]|uniref:hypothetical protein n=1 Tax=Pedobacter mucosus TaxID=2895286 RepID=UPI001EE3E98D|nr:hypothetical protein [Pedobacter mucosus]UKT65877.1 hypothetical protein LOK61_08810 [Pedobacter mucosus]
MKNALHLTTILLVFTSLFSCKKTDNVLDFNIDDRNLTGCPINTTCNYSFTNNSIKNDDQFLLAKGSYKVFSFQQQNSFSTTFLYFQAPMVGNKFLLNKTDILEARVKYLFSCPACNWINLKPVDGIVKGMKVEQDVSLPEKWLIESNIILASEGPINIRDTVYTKQYYYPAVK